MAACGQLKSATERERKSRAQIAAEAGLDGGMGEVRIGGYATGAGGD